MAQPTTEGVAVVVSGYVRDQVARGWDVHVACPADAGWLADRVAAAGAAVHAWRATRAPGPAVPSEVRRLGRVVDAVAPDLVHLHSAKAGLAGRLAVRGRVSTVFQPHAWSFHAAGPVSRAARRWESLAGRWTDLLVCVSEDERREGELAGVHAPVVVVPNGIDLADLPAADAQDRAEARDALALPPGPLAVCVGRLARQKGQDLLVAAWPEVRRALPTARLALVGDGPEREALVAAAGPGVLVVGSRDDVPTWLAAADVVAVPSRWEGMALAPLEAMARGRSVVVSDAAGLAESVPTGAGGRVTTDEGWSAALVRRLADPDAADREGAVGRAHVVAHHDAVRAAERVAAAYPSAPAG